MLVYKFTSPSGKSYIGKTKDLQKRLYAHKYSIRKGVKSKFYDACRKYNFDNFNIEVLIDDITTDLELSTIEQFYISFYDTVNQGYNMTVGGTGGNTRQGIKVSKETKLKMSQSQLGKPKRNKGQCGKTKPSKETKDKISKIVADTRWVSNIMDEKSIKIHKSELKTYLSQGWVRGQIWFNNGKVKAPKKLKLLKETT